MTDNNIQQWCWAQAFHGLHLGTDRPLIWPNLTRIVMKSSAIMRVIITPFLDRLHLFKRTVVESILIYIPCWRIKKCLHNIGCTLIIQRITEKIFIKMGTILIQINIFSLDLNLRRSAQRKRSSDILIG